MAEKIMMKGNEALAEGAIRGGLQCYFGYPITPQSEVAEYLSKRMPELGRVFLQTESEVATINYLYGAAGAGVRCMTTSSSPGISLMQEGISYCIGAQLPVVLANVVRGGPGLGNIMPAQCDYFQATRPGHGDCRAIVLAPNSVQEMFDFARESFELAEKYRNMVIILTDGSLGQMMEPVELKEFLEADTSKNEEWATTGAKNRERHVISSIELEPEDMERYNKELEAKYELIKKHEVRYETYQTEDADLILVAYGIASRICRNAVDEARSQGIKLGLIRPITVWPFPEEVIRKYAEKQVPFLVVELSMGQMVEDVKLASEGRTIVDFYGRYGGVMPTVKEIVEKAVSTLKKSGRDK